MSQNFLKNIPVAPIRVLHVVGGMNRGGIETWLMHILRSIDRDRIQMDFLVHTNEPCPYDAEIKALGSRIIPCLSPVKPHIYRINFQKVLAQYGPYDIVHSHVHFFSGYVLRIAQKAGVPIRIAHSHNDTSSIESKAKWSRKVYLALMYRWIIKYATLGLAASDRAGADLFGQQWRKNSRWKILYYGIDLSSFQGLIELHNIRAKLGISENAIVIGHVGRFVPQKNHKFIIEIAKVLIEKNPKIFFLLVGVGELRSQIEQQARELGIGDHIYFVGSRDDVPTLMRGVMDLFLFPSLYEGLGLVLVEAQAAGLPCIFADTVPSEADIVLPLLKRLNLSLSAVTWAQAILEKIEDLPNLNKTASFQQVENSIFNIQSSTRALIETYANSIKR